MYQFFNDYSEGAHPRILQALAEHNLEQTSGYGTDSICQQTADLIRNLCKSPEADVHFLVGGTQTNLLLIESLLHPYEAVIAAETGHINLHETGAIESTGHKVCTVPAPDGKLTPALIEMVLNSHDGSEHMVLPKLVYISNTTELGTVYRKAELNALHRFCQEHALYLFLDGARLGSALTAEGQDLSLPDLAALTDAFSLGGTKNGALFGETLVINGPVPRTHFRWHMKQRGALLAKGRLLGLQFLTLLKDGLYWEMAQHANQQAQHLRKGLQKMGLSFLVDSPSNQQFPLLPVAMAEQLEQLGYQFAVQPQPDARYTCARFVTSWATPEEAVNQLLRDLDRCL